MKKLLIVILSFVFISSVSASTKTYPRLDSNNYGVNKDIKINSNNLDNVQSTYLVDASEKVYDFADILTDDEEDDVYELISEFISLTNMDMVFLSIDMPYSYDSKHDEYASQFYDYNDFGIDFNNYSGILLLRNDYNFSRYYNIYAFGDAQLYFSHNRLENILDTIYNDFVSKDYYDGISTFVSMSSSYYESGIPNEMKNYYIDLNGFLVKNYVVPIMPCFIGSSIITLIVMLILVKKNKMVKKASKATEYLDISSINYSVSNDQFINSHTSSYTVSSSSGGGGSRSGSSGRGFSSGGGRHG